MPNTPPLDPPDVLSRAWELLQAAAAAARRGGGPLAHADGAWLTGKAPYGASMLAPPAVRALLDLYGPFCAAGPGRPLTVAHLGQSLDGYIATDSGDSYYVTGPENVRHLHRLRALAAAVVVGAGTIERDDPRLTVRHVAGANPVRIVLDPSARLTGDRQVFKDGAAPTLVVHGEGVTARPPGNAEILRVPTADGRLDLGVLLERLHERGWFAVFVEGGGATVSHFLEADLLDRLHVAIAPLVTGRGRPGLNLPARERIADCLRPQHRVFTMGGDVLFDCDLRAAAPSANESSGSLTRAI